MAKFELDTLKIEYAMNAGIFSWANKLYNLSKNTYVPRDWERAPKPLRFKGIRKNKPQRNIRKKNRYFYRSPVKKNGVWYAGVTGNLKRSIGIENTWYLEWTVWVVRGPTEVYAEKHEFGSKDGKTPARSFLRKPLQDHGKEIIAQIQATFNEIIRK